MKPFSVLLVLVLSIFVSSSIPEQVDDVRIKMQALEFFLQDQWDHTKYCSQLKWQQPPFDMYKADPRSYLPKECKSSRIESI